MSIEYLYYFRSVQIYAMVLPRFIDCADEISKECNLQRVYTNFFIIARSNPIFLEEEEQEVVIIVDSLDETPEAEPEPPRVPRRAPSTSSGQ